MPPQDEDNMDEWEEEEEVDGSPNARNRTQYGGDNGQPNQQEQVAVTHTNPEEDQKRDEIANLFFTLSTEIGASDETIKLLVQNTVDIKQKRYFRMSKNQEEDFLKALELVNKNLGKAQTMLDTYIELEKSQPEFKNFYNKFYHLYETINNFRRTVFYNENAKDEEYLYPLIDIKTKFGGLSFLFSRLCGNLETSGNYIRHIIYLNVRQAPMGVEGHPVGYGGGYGGGYGYPPIRDYYDDRFGLSGRREPKQEIRDIGDAKDTQ